MYNQVVVCIDCHLPCSCLHIFKSEWVTAYLVNIDKTVRDKRCEQSDEGQWDPHVLQALFVLQPKEDQHID